MLMVRNAAIALTIFLGVFSGATAQTKPTDAGGQAKPAGAPPQAKPTPPESYTAVTSKNMTPGAGTKLLIQILRWSSDEDRDKALSVIAGGPAKEDPAPAAKPAESDAAAQKKAAAAAPAAPPDPVKALESIPTAGYIWSTGPLGYAVKYAHRTTTPDGGQRIVLVTDRPLGSWERPAWKASGQAASSPYTVIEVRLNSKGRGEGKASLAAPFAIDQQAKTVVLTEYEKAPVLLQDVQRAPQGYSR
jgi:hypothetical protein